MRRTVVERTYQCVSSGVVIDRSRNAAHTSLRRGSTLWHTPRSPWVYTWGVVTDRTNGAPYWSRGDVRGELYRSGEIVSSRSYFPTGNQHVRSPNSMWLIAHQSPSFFAVWSRPLNVLINNAGVLAPHGQWTPGGWEIQLTTNYLEHFALAIGLHGALAARGIARMVKYRMK